MGPRVHRSSQPWEPSWLPAERPPPWVFGMKTVRTPLSLCWWHKAVGNSRCGMTQLKKLGRIKWWAMAESGQLYGGGSKNARRLWFSGYIILFLACYELCKNKDSVWGYKEDLLKMTPIAGSGFWDLLFSASYGTRSSFAPARGSVLLETRMDPRSPRERWATALASLRWTTSPACLSMGWWKDGDLMFFLLLLLIFTLCVSSNKLCSLTLKKKSLQNGWWVDRANDIWKAIELLIIQYI